MKLPPYRIVTLNTLLAGLAVLAEAADRGSELAMEYLQASTVNIVSIADRVSLVDTAVERPAAGRRAD